MAVCAQGCDAKLLEIRFIRRRGRVDQRKEYVGANIRMDTTKLAFFRRKMSLRPAGRIKTAQLGRGATHRFGEPSAGEIKRQEGLLFPCLRSVSGHRADFEHLEVEHSRFIGDDLIFVVPMIEGDSVETPLEKIDSGRTEKCDRIGIDAVLEP